MVMLMVMVVLSVVVVAVAVAVMVVVATVAVVAVAVAVAVAGSHLPPWPSPVSGVALPLYVSVKMAVFSTGPDQGWHVTLGCAWH